MSSCKFCLKVCKNEHGLAIHLPTCKAKKHQEEESNKHYCDFCKKPFVSLWNLKRHLDQRKCVKFSSDLESKEKEVNTLKELIENKESTLKEIIENKDTQILHLQSQLTSLQQQNIENNKNYQSIVQTLSNKVGNTYNQNNQNNIVQTNNNLLAVPLTNDLLGKCIEAVDPILLSRKPTTMNEFFPLISDEINKHKCVYVSDCARNTIVYNDGKGVVKDVQAKKLSKSVAKHYQIKKLSQKIQQNLDRDDPEVCLKQVQLALDILVPENVAKYLIPGLPSKVSAIESLDELQDLTKFVQSVRDSWLKYPQDYIFVSPKEMGENIRGNVIFLNSEKMICENDQREPRQLNGDLLVKILREVYKSLDSVAEFPTFLEKAFKKIASKELVDQFIANRAWLTSTAPVPEIVLALSQK
jgi:hypothetical protein